MPRVKELPKTQLTVCINPQNAQLIWAEAKTANKTSSEVVDLALTKYFENQREKGPSGSS